MAFKKGSAQATSTAKKGRTPLKKKTLSAAKQSTSIKKAAVKKVSSKVAAKKARVKKAPVKKAPVAKTAPSKKVTAVRERFSKTQIISELAANSDLTRKQVNTLLTELATLVERHVKKRSVGEFVLAGLIKIHTVKRPAKKAYTGTNPFTGKETTFKARPASVAVKVHALKGLKDMAQ
ncbi:DNA-binding protein HU, putative [marine gamma proteobacterium HTCC2207]|uniref:DNA-binding protein HU, putative n=1 Tax=gamma proteobacterium HTCC2207 TaxID=314287 RepID=Q1YQ66_9GAMM|nr:DNA-binding protein HU, putative [marine gamma proteobacterium HTCC2207] [gamma proteobacterium HTCC2207]